MPWGGGGGFTALMGLGFRGGLGGGLGGGGGRAVIIVTLKTFLWPVALGSSWAPRVGIGFFRVGVLPILLVLVTFYRDFDVADVIALP